MKTIEDYKKNATDDYIGTPISVLRYISELEDRLGIGASELSQNVVCRFFKKHKKLILGCLAILLLSFGFRQGDEWYRLIYCFVGGAVIGLI